MSIVVLLGLGIILFFAFFAYLGRVRKAGQKPLPRAPKQLAVRFGPEATQEGIASLVQRAGISPQGAKPAQLIAILPALGAARGFPGGFWHPENLSAGSDVMAACFKELGLEVVGEDEVRQCLETLRVNIEGDEERARRAQIAAVMALANNKLQAQSDPRRFRAYAEDLPGWDPAEPAWILADLSEHELLVDLDILRPKPESSLKF